MFKYSVKLVTLTYLRLNDFRYIIYLVCPYELYVSEYVKVSKTNCEMQNGQMISL